MGLLNADAETYAQFLSDPVKVAQVDVYQASNYGTSVTPFYTTLALWVGAIILVALIKCQVDYKDEEYMNARPLILVLRSATVVLLLLRHRHC